MKAPLIRLSLIFTLAGSVFALMLGMHTLLILLCMGEIILLLASGAFDDRKTPGMHAVALVGMFLLIGMMSGDQIHRDSQYCKKIKAGDQKAQQLCSHCQEILGGSKRGRWSERQHCSNIGVKVAKTPSREVSLAR